MAVLGTYTDIRTVAVAATASAGYAHGITNTQKGAFEPQMVRAMPVYATGSLSTAFPYLSAQWDSASVTLFNRGTVAETYHVETQYLHTTIQ